MPEGLVNIIKDIAVGGNVQRRESKLAGYWENCLMEKKLLRCLSLLFMREETRSNKMECGR